MPRRHPDRRPIRALPRIWLMTDERMGEGLWRALERLPRGAGVVFRHYDAPDRLDVWKRIRRIARRHGLVLLSAGGALPGADGVHNGGRRDGGARGLRTRAAHDRQQAAAAIHAGADALFVSPVHATRSHPGARVLGGIGFARLSRDLPVPAIALGGMDARRFRALRRLGAYGWAAIDAWLPGEYRAK